MLLAGLRGSQTTMAALRLLSARTRLHLSRQPQRLYTNQKPQILESGFMHSKRFRRTALVAGATLALGSYTVYNYDTAYLVFASLQRCSVAANVTCKVAYDYLRHFPELPSEPVSAAEMQQILDQRSLVHLRSAERVKHALMKNGGVYIKLGQHISAMQYVLPLEWCSTMQALQDQNTASSLDDVNKVVCSEFGQTIDEMFSDFDPTPIGVASLAQVHRAVLRSTGEPVAVKVQHPTVRKYSDIDIATVSVMFEFIHSVFADFKFMWLSAEMKESLPKELDFRSDKANAEQVLWNFSKRPDIPLAVPRMIRASERVLIMEYVDGKRCDSLEYLKQHNIDPAEVSRQIGRVFAEMTFVDGFLHCDPHPGNMFVRPRHRSETAHGHNFDLVLLDHGLYRQLPPRFRYEYAEMWHAMMRGDQEQIRYWSKRLSGTDLYKLFSTILTGQNWDTIENKELASTTKQASFSMDSMLLQHPNLIAQITEVLASVPPVLLLVLKTNDLLRMVDQKLFADQPLAVQQHAQLKSWARISHFCLAAIRDARAVEIRQSGSRFSIRRITGLLANWFGFWAQDTALWAFDLFLSFEDMLIRWKSLLKAPFLGLSGAP